MSTQVTIIGGGSYQWGPELMADLFGTPSLKGMHLVLAGHQPGPLPKMEALAHKLNEALASQATIATTTDQRASLEGADFVIVCISTGAFRSMAVDLVGAGANSGSPRRWATRWVLAGSTAHCATSRCSSGLARTWRRSAPMPGC